MLGLCGRYSQKPLKFEVRLCFRHLTIISNFANRVEICANCSEIKVAVKQEIAFSGEPVTREPEVVGLNRFLELSFDDSDMADFKESDGVDDDDFEECDIKEGWVHQSSHLI